MLFINAKTVYDIICLSNKGVIQELMNGPFNKKLLKFQVNYKTRLLYLYELQINKVNFSCIGRQSIFF